MTPPEPVLAKGAAREAERHLADRRDETNDNAALPMVVRMTCRVALPASWREWAVGSQ